jgi:hypothetical protein
VLWWCLYNLHSWCATPSPVPADVTALLIGPDTVCKMGHAVHMLPSPLAADGSSCTPNRNHTTQQQQPTSGDAQWVAVSKPLHICGRTAQAGK